MGVKNIQVCNKKLNKGKNNYSIDIVLQLPPNKPQQQMLREVQS